MDVSIGKVAAQSALSGRVFQPGDRVWSFLGRDERGELERIDILDDEQSDVPQGRTWMAKWSQEIREAELSPAEEARSRLMDAEGLFLSLYEEEAVLSPEAVAERDRLKFFLSLQLERKRVLKPLGAGRYRHMPTKQELMVPQFEMTPELVAAYLSQT
jgi:hypothetical protein